MPTPSVLGLITARGQSKGIPGKNIAPCGGKPLIAWTIEAAKRARLLDRVLVSTDDEAIAKVSREWGAECPFLRPAELATDHAGSAGVAIHALEWLEKNDGYVPEYFVILQPTSPLRTAEDIDGAISLAWEKNAEAVIGVTEPLVNVYLMRQLREDGTMDYLFEESRKVLPRQKNPQSWLINGSIYLVRRDVFLKEKKFMPKMTYPYVMPQERSIDIDTPYHMEVCDYYLRKANHGN